MRKWVHVEGAVVRRLRTTFVGWRFTFAVDVQREPGDEGWEQLDWTSVLASADVVDGDIADGVTVTMDGEELVMDAGGKVRREIRARRVVVTSSVSSES